MAAWETIELADGSPVKARMTKYLGTLTGTTPGNLCLGGGDAMRAEYTDEAGNVHVCQSPENDGRAVPVEEPA